MLKSNNDMLVLEFMDYMLQASNKIYSFASFVVFSMF